jgi:NDP-sugar pyrophosphorylase family protein
MDVARIPVFILAGGRGSRLAGLTDLPKPLVPVAGRPFVAYLLGALHRQGFRRVFFLTGFGAEAFAQVLDQWVRSGDASSHARLPSNERAFLTELEIRFLPEESPLGTGGALRRALVHVDSQALVLNGDSYCDSDYRELLGLLQTRSAAFSLTAVHEPDASDYGCLALDENDVVRGFEEKGRAGEGWINAGVYALERRFLEEAIPEGKSSLETEVLPAWVKQEQTPACRVHCFFRDIGTPERLAQAQREFPPRSLR